MITIPQETEDSHKEELKADVEDKGGPVARPNGDHEYRSVSESNAVARPKQVFETTTLVDLTSIGNLYNLSKLPPRMHR